jgi:hypothetical protein
MAKGLNGESFFWHPTNLSHVILVYILLFRYFSDRRYENEKFEGKKHLTGKFHDLKRQLLK